MGDKEDTEHTIANDLVVTKYKMAAEITNSESIKKIMEHMEVNWGFLAGNKDNYQLKPFHYVIRYGL